MPPDVLHVHDDAPGITRSRSGRGFSYRDPSGVTVTDPGERRRIERLVIPPAWTDVWICPDPKGHIQATGRDARGRKQYIYHADFRRWREEAKFQHILDFAAALPRLREAVARDLADRRLSRRLVLATAVRLLERTLMRIGNDEYAAHNQSYGLTTLQWEHVERDGVRVHFSFRAKHGKTFEASLADRRVAAILRRLEGLPGQHLLQFVDGAGQRHRITSDDVNAYIREATGGDFSAKDFRTWAATVLAVTALLSADRPSSPTATKRTVSQAVKQVAQRLNNTPAVCRSSYIHPEVIEAYSDGTLAALARQLEGVAQEDEGPGLVAAERTVLRFLKRRMRRKTEEPGGGREARETPVSLPEALAASLA